MKLLKKTLFQYLSKNNKNIKTIKTKQFISNIQINFKIL